MYIFIFVCMLPSALLLHFPRAQTKWATETMHCLDANRGVLMFLPLSKRVNKEQILDMGRQKRKHKLKLDDE